MSDHDQPNLFATTAFNEFKKFGLQTETVERVIQKKYVTLLGKRFELEDLYLTLLAVEEDDVVVNDPMAKTLIELGVLGDSGNRRWGSGATMGENWREFYEMVRTARNEKEPSTDSGFKP